MAKAKTTPAKKSPKKSNGHGAAVAATWKDSAVRAARAVRTPVRVKGEQYRSVGEAFEALGLPNGSVVRFRMALKASPTSRATFEAADGSKFQFTALAYE